MTEPPRRRTLSVRVGFALAALVTLVLVIVAVLVSIVVLGPSDEDAAGRLDRAEAIVRADADRWEDPAWRRATVDDLADDAVTVVLVDHDEELDRSGGDDGDVIVRVVADPDDPTRTARLSTPVDDDLWSGILRATIAIAAVAALVAWVFGRPFVRSLDAVRRAADRVSDGDLDVELPRSRIAEVDAVNSAFATMTEELHRSLQQQAELEQERRLFIAAVAHDLRTPLFSLRGYLEGLESGVAEHPDQQARYLAIANEKARTLDGLVSDLFEFTRVEYLDRTLQRRALDLVEVLHDLVDGLRPLADGQGVELVLLPHDHSVLVEIDREQFDRAVTNLIDNAIRHAGDGGRVDVACGAEGPGGWCSVSDTGPGIAAADLPHLFQPLYRGSLTDGPGPGGGGDQGTGLGLAIAQRIVAAHGGTLTAANAPDGGAVFRATIPPSSPGPTDPPSG